MSPVSRALCSLVLPLALCGPSGCNKPPPPVTSTAQAPDKSPSVAFYPASGSPWLVKVELAKNDSERARGLMYRRELAKDTGMLFLFEAPEIRRFWMRNTYLPLDIIFLNERKVVVGIEENTVPMDETSRGPDQPAQYVVEVLAGEARKHGVHVGARVEFLQVEGAP
ncbi:MAG: DUF192 domain-containing protein [Myxococcales bacterium]|nr:DUF192 domain-containing protein [Myxococcales bacterium]